MDVSMLPSRRVILRGAAVAIIAAVGVSLAAPSYAGPPGTWTTLGSTGVSSISQPGVARTGANLTVAWTVETGGTDSILTRAVTPAGAAAATQAAVSGWASTSWDPKVLTYGSGRQVLFSGLRTTTTGAPYGGHNVYRATAGASWSLGPEKTFDDTYAAYGGYGYGAVDLPGGRTLTAYSLNGVVYFADTTAHTNSLNVPGNESNYNTSLVRDGASGRVWVLVYLGDSDATSATKTGVWAHELDVSTGIVPVGGWARQPGSVSNTAYGWNAINPLQDLPVASPAGGGAYVAYGVGYPSVTHVRVQRLDAPGGFTVAAPGADVRNISLTSYGSRLWVSGSKGSQIWAARTNPARTVVGKIGRLAAPSGASIYQLSTEGATGRLDVVVTAQPYPKPMAVYHTQLQAALTVTVSKKKLKSAKGGKEKITVTDAGAAVAGATVTVAGKSKTTNAKGKVKFKVAKGTAKGKYKVVVKANGYAVGKAKFRVR